MQKQKLSYQISDDDGHSHKDFIEDAHDVFPCDLRYVVQGLAGVVPDPAVAVRHAR